MEEGGFKLLDGSTVVPDAQQAQLCLVSGVSSSCKMP